ncbi:Panacea domain-containing protein [Salinarimonas chemoclinalis]|uniref:Panacea domain-containing protein n=1 Tax=Salinarimonas chemoclinalis TaxID=3241599 RepID=UPI003558FEF7
MMSAARFRMDWGKAVESIHYLATIHPGITPFFISKVLYYADKEHLMDWGRPVTGDFYVAMENGPVPSNTYRLVNREASLDDDIIADFDARVERKDRNLFAKVPFNAVRLSGSDMECLSQADELYGHMSFGALRDLVHKERSWREAWEARYGMAHPMQMEAMVDDELPEREELVKEIYEKAAYI